MRDILIISLVLIGSLIALRRPWIGVLLWTWLSLMNPHRYTWGMAYEAPLAAIAAGSTLVGLLMTRERSSPFKNASVVIFGLLSLWITISWLLGLDWSDDLAQWQKVMKINLMIFLALALLHSKKHIFALAWVCAGSLGLIGAKGGLFTVMTGGAHRVWGPPDSFIYDNNAFALALVMTIPLLRFLQLQLSSFRARQAMTVAMVLLAAAALGSHSRGGFLAICAMTGLFWWRSSNRLRGGIVIAMVAVALLAFMPEEWSLRMSSIETYEEDQSAQGRFAAWWVAWRAAVDYPFGVGFNAARPELFALYSPYPDLGTPVAHSIYFQMLGHHGFIGLFLFVLMWLATWRAAATIRKQSAGIPEAKWCGELAGMAQVSLLGYAAGGTFLNLSYFDLPYNVLALVALTQVWLRNKAWEREPTYVPGWRTVPGLAPAVPVR